MGDMREHFDALKRHKKRQKQDRKAKNMELLRKVSQSGYRVEQINKEQGHYRIHNSHGRHGDVWVTTGTVKIGRHYRGKGLRWLLRQLSID